MSAAQCGALYQLIMQPKGRLSSRFELQQEPNIMERIIKSVDNEVNYYRESARSRGRKAQAMKRRAEREMLETTSLKDLIK
jgi:hypothetical protein